MSPLPHRVTRDATPAGRLWAWLPVVLLACGGASDDSGATASAPPEVAGRYNVQVLWASGCEGDSSWVEDWAMGPLSVEGTDGSLSFDFYDDMIFPGQVDGGSKATFGGSATWAQAQLDVTWTGSFAHPEDQWIMTGEFAIIVDDDQYTSNNCTVQSGIEAYELVGTN